MKTKQVLEMLGSLKIRREIYELLLQKGQITSAQMRFYQTEEQKDPYIRSRHEQLMTHMKEKNMKELRGSVYSVLMFQTKSQSFNHPDAPFTWTAHIPGSLRDATLGTLLSKALARLSVGQTLVIIHQLCSGLQEMPTTPALTQVFVSRSA